MQGHLQRDRVGGWAARVLELQAQLPDPVCVRNKQEEPAPSETADLDLELTQVTRPPRGEPLWVTGWCFLLHAWLTWKKDTAGGPTWDTEQCPPSGSSSHCSWGGQAAPVRSLESQCYRMSYDSGNFHAIILQVASEAHSPEKLCNIPCPGAWDLTILLISSSPFEDQSTAASIGAQPQPGNSPVPQSPPGPLGMGTGAPASAQGCTCFLSLFREPSRPFCCFLSFLLTKVCSLLRSKLTLVSRSSWKLSNSRLKSCRCCSRSCCVADSTLERPWSELLKGAAPGASQQCRRLLTWDMTSVIRP